MSSYRYNSQCFEDIELSFEDGKGGAKDWSIIVGDNGWGKTTILRSLAAGLCDKEGASALLAELHGGFLRREETKGSIEICLKDIDKSEEYTITTQIELDGNNESISQEIDPDDGSFKREDIFAVAYGAGRSMTGTESYQEYALVDSLYTLFNYGHPLQNAELGASRVKIHSEDEWKELQNILKKVLMLKGENVISLERTGLYVNTDLGKDVVDAVGDGHRSLTSIIIDFLSWSLLYNPNFTISDLSGIFIIDELEQHIHPKWQREIVKLLSDQFPKVQFICSTHTPICALGLSDLESGSWLFNLTYVNGRSDIKEKFDFQEDFKGYRSDQILTSGIFNLTAARSVSIEKKLKRYREIYLKEDGERDDEEESQLRKIEEELKDLPMWDDEEEKIQRESLIELLKSQREVLNNDKD